jgi:hypothetical protein
MKRRSKSLVPGEIAITPGDAHLRARRHPVMAPRGVDAQDPGLPLHLDAIEKRIEQRGIDRHAVDARQVRHTVQEVPAAVALCPGSSPAPGGR